MVPGKQLLPPANLRRLCFYTCLSFCSQGGVCLSACWDIISPGTRHPSPGLGTPLGPDPTRPPPWDQVPPRTRPPLTRSPWDQAPPPPGPGTPLGPDPPKTRHPPGPDSPLRSACWEIWSTSGRYASYWNAILIIIIIIYFLLLYNVHG